MKRATFQLSAGQKIDGGVLIAIHGDAGRIHFQVAMCEGHADCYWVLLHRCLRRKSRLSQLSQTTERLALPARHVDAICRFNQANDGPNSGFGIAYLGMSCRKPWQATGAYGSCRVASIKLPPAAYRSKQRCCAGPDAMGLAQSL